MVRQAARESADLEACETWQPRHLAALQALEGILSDFDYQRFLSRYHRVGALIPQIRGRRRHSRRNGESELLARLLPSDTRAHQVARDEALYAALESRSKETLWLGDGERALAHAEELMQPHPAMSRTWFHQGNILLRLDRIAEAQTRTVGPCATALRGPQERSPRSANARRSSAIPKPPPTATSRPSTTTRSEIGAANEVAELSRGAAGLTRTRDYAQDVLRQLKPPGPETAGRAGMGTAQRLRSRTLAPQTRASMEPAVTTPSSPFIPTSFLARLSESEQALEALGIRRTFPRGALLMFEHEPAERVMIILTGHVKISQLGEDGRELVLSLRDPGDLVGELGSIGGQPRIATATALAHVQALVIPAQAFRSHLERTPRVAVVLLETLTDRFRETTVRRSQFTESDTMGRVAARILELADRYGEPADGGTSVAMPLSQEELAAWAGASRAGVAHALQSMRELGWIHTGRRLLQVLDAQALRDRAAKGAPET
jgi:CRP-like cAMP-binding protein